MLTEDREDAVASLESVSLFSNCGAGDVGFARARFRFRVLAEIDERRLDVALRNHRHAFGIVGDLRETWPEVVASYREHCGSTQPDLLSACPFTFTLLSGSGVAVSGLVARRGG